MGVIKDILRTMDYGPSPEGKEHVTAWLEQHKNGFGCFINGAFTKPRGLFDVFNPATGEAIARATQGSPADIDAAVAAARKAQAEWAALSGFERSKHLYALARHVQKRERFLSVLETIDNGKPIREFARHRHSARRPPFLSSCGLGLADRAASFPERSRSASAGRSSRGTFRCSCSPGRSRLRSPPAIRWC